MINNYSMFNESKSMKNRGNRGRNQKYQDSFNKKYAAGKISSQDFDVVLHLSPRLEYAVNKMAEIGNPVSKEILKALKDGRTSEISFLDMSRNVDNISYLTKEVINRNDFNENEAYRSSRRTSSKIYKAMRLLFGNKFTKNEISKFVSVYKSVYSKGPDKNLIKNDKESKNIPINETIQKIIDDTKKGKLKWRDIPMNTSTIKKKRCIIPITKMKYMEIDFYIMFDNPQNNFMSFNLSDGNKLSFIKSINFKRDNMEDLFSDLEKYV